MNKHLASVATISLWAVLVTACDRSGMMGPGMMGLGNMMGLSMARHHLVMMNGLDPKYARKVNPLARDEQTLKSGRKLFEQNCARCHGINGLGDGPDGTNLNPRPANVAAVAKMPMASDSYLFWSISEGGTPVGSAMPPFQGTLNEKEIWQTVAYLRVL